MSSPPSHFTPTKWRFEDRPCPICGSRDARLLGRRGGTAHREEKGVETGIVRCRRCHGVYQRPTLLPESNPYDWDPVEHYFQLHDSSRKVEAGEKLAAYAESVIGRPGRMLELGCGRGELLRGAANRGWQVLGIEMTKGFAEVACERHRIEVESAPIAEAQALSRTYDVVLLAAILEHLYDPIQTLDRVRAALNRGGLIFIDVPNECSLMTIVGNLYLRLRRTDWAMNLSPSFSPFHVVGFCPRSLRHLLGSTGFSIRSLQLHRWNNAMPPAAGLRGHVERMALDGVLTAGQLMGRGAGITCWATRGD